MMPPAVLAKLRVFVVAVAVAAAWGLAACGAPDVRGDAGADAPSVAPDGDAVALDGDASLPPLDGDAQVDAPPPQCGPSQSQCTPGRCTSTPSDPSNCGACGRVCAGAGEVCARGACVPLCRAGASRCDDVCADTASDPAHCGACGRRCAAGEYCAAGRCVASCPAGLRACGARCVDTASDPGHCGACDNACAAGEACAAGACGPGCPAPLARCGAACVDTARDPAHCGACGRACAAGEACARGACVARCPAGTTLCAGACVDTAGDPAHCGACGRACAPGEACGSGLCRTGCPAGQVACNRGCVHLLGDVAHCGACGNACGPTQVCSGGRCVGRCGAGSTSCGGSCRDLASDRDHCGECGRRCAAGEVCAFGQCAPACPAGRTDCDGSCRDLASDWRNCGLCGAVCAPGAACVAGRCVAGQRCQGLTDCGGACADLRQSVENCGACGVVCDRAEDCIAGRCGTCPAGFVACNGVCRDARNDPQHCGGCGNVCRAPSATSRCAAGRCEFTCSAGFADCDGVAANGCEVYLQADVRNCGACGRACPPAPNANPACTSGACRVNCLFRRADCDGDAANGCEAALDTPAHCGACGRACGPEEYCSAPAAGGVVACRPVESTDFALRIDELAATGCRAVEHGAATGRDRGGVVATTAAVFVTGQTATARTDPELRDPVQSLGGRRDALVADVRTGALYALARGFAEVTPDGGWVDALLAADPRFGFLSAARVALSTPIWVPPGSGIFSGAGRVVVHNTSRVYDIAVPSGRVRDLGPMPTPAHRACASWAYWGVAEWSAGALSLVMVRDAQTVVRVAVPSGAVTTVATFTDLGAGACAVAVSRLARRWYVHHQGPSQFAPAASATAESLVTCSARLTE